jgi:preprotein translocase subunit SecG
MLDLLNTPITVLHVIVCLMLMLVVLIQPGKSGGLGAALGGAGAQQIFGGRGAGNFLTRTTWIAATVFFLTSVTLAYVSTSTGDSLEDLANTPLPAITPVPGEGSAAEGSAPPDSPVPGSAEDNTTVGAEEAPAAPSAVDPAEETPPEPSDVPPATP